MTIIHLLFAAAVASAQPQVTPSVIYGNDDRADLYQVKDPRTLALADSVVSLFRPSDVTVQNDVATLSVSEFGTRMSMCADEPFFHQPMGAFCSGSLVAPDVIMTAGHCVTSDADCANVRFVFGFAVKKEGEMPGTVPAGEVYSCKALIDRQQENKGADYALLRLDRPVVGHKPLALNHSGTIDKGAPVFVIGHPVGMPVKVAGGAAVRDASSDGFFVANLDTYGGNSGSPVFNASNGLVEGILVRGENDFIYDNARQCRVSNRCADDACRGEDVTKIAVVAPKIPLAEQALRAEGAGESLEQTAAGLRDKSIR